MKAAFDRIYIETERGLRGFLAGLMSDPHDREECFQETYLRLWKQLAVAAPARPFAWLIVVARRCAAARGRERENDPSALQRSSTEDPSQESFAVTESLSELPDDLRETFCLRHLGGLSYAEIAAEQELPIGTVSSRIHRAVELLRARVLDERQETRRSHEPR